jgi:hypothetical protein
MLAADLKRFVTAKNYHRRLDVEKECGCFPNRVYRINGWFVLVVLESVRGPDWPIGERGLDRAIQSLKAGRVDNAYVMLMQRGKSSDDGDLQYVNHDTIGNVCRKLSGIEPEQHQEKLGRCWFVDEQFNHILVSSKPKQDEYVL